MGSFVPLVIAVCWLVAIVAMLVFWVVKWAEILMWRGLCADGRGIDDSALGDWLRRHARLR